ncbi:hypothetical protein E4H12_01110 [Candidatus Thorarchaeota archaeon]|nr:MAG: hypothetical protein E4H12_01110 [Candidatus Thorarchaeota archaeon]
MRITPDKMNKLDGRVCFICGKYLLNYTEKDMAYLKVHSGSTMKAKPNMYHLFSCPSCTKMAHKRCWYDVGEKKVKKGWFGKSEYILSCPSCGTDLSSKREKRVDWNRGYEIPDHPESEILELHVSDVVTWKAGSVFGKIGKAIDNFFQAVGLGSLTNPERNAVARAASNVGKTIQDVAERVFKIKLTPQQRAELKELRCQNCDAPLPMPGEFVDAVVCAHCGTAHLL